MKKIITLLLLIGGFACTASADDYIVSGNASIVNEDHSWYHVDNDNKLSETTTNGIYTLVVTGCSLTANTNYGFKIKKNQDGWEDRKSVV